MVPSAVVLMDALPLTENRKVDRKALPAPDGHDRTCRAEYVGPGTHLEEVLQQIWSDVLRLEQVSIYDDFFEMGGHSLMVTQVIARLRETFHVDLPVRALFDAPTIASFAVLMLQD